MEPIVLPFFKALKDFMMKERKRLNPWWRKFFLLKPVNPHVNEILNWIDTYFDDIHRRYFLQKHFTNYSPFGIKFSNVPTEELEGWMNEARECKDLLILCKRAGMFIL